MDPRQHQHWCNKCTIVESRRSNNCNSCINATTAHEPNSKSSDHSHYARILYNLK